jgi:RNA-directed DNA polymerase
MKPDWFKPRGYSHFDACVGDSFAACIDEGFVEKHSWSPLISYTKRVKRYKKLRGKTEYKNREIMYASHRDACILSKYSVDLTTILNQYYHSENLEDNVIAYRPLGKANFHFSADAQRFAVANAPCVILCFDVTGFFDNLDHGILKNRLKRILKVKELSKAWYAIFRQVSRFHHVRRDALALHPKFGRRLKMRLRRPLATIDEVIRAKIKIHPNKTKGIGIPQGTPISSALSNLYLIDLDKAMSLISRKEGALYQRYSDDILIICRVECEHIIRTTLEDQIIAHRLEINPNKIDRIIFDFSNPEVIQYLGFNLSPNGAVIRPNSLARQWRKVKRNIARTKAIGAVAVANGSAKKIFTKKLRRRFSPIGVRNFSSYSRRSAKAFRSKNIIRQVRRLERKADKAIRDLN